MAEAAWAKELGRRAKEVMGGKVELVGTEKDRRQEPLGRIPRADEPRAVGHLPLRSRWEARLIALVMYCLSCQGVLVWNIDVDVRCDRVYDYLVLGATHECVLKIGQLRH